MPRPACIRRAIPFGSAAALTAVLLIAPTAAPARTITVGPPLTDQYPVSVTFLFPSVTVGNTALGDPEANAVSPVDGVVLRWRLVAQGAADAYALRVLHPAAGGAYAGAGTSTSRIASTASTQTFATNLPIQKGDAIGINMPKASPSIKGASLPGATDPYWAPVFEDGAAAMPTGSVSTVEFGFNADVQPAPRVVVASPSAGPVGGGTAVTIAGSDFAGVKDVRFGSVPASSFTVDSEAEITAVAPPAAGAGAVDVSVTTIAGTSPSRAGDRFTYEAPPAPATVSAPPPSPSPPPPPAPTCLVPKLIGKNLKSARKALLGAKCKLGKVTRASRKASKVARQSPKPGTTKPADSAVNVSLG